MSELRDQLEQAREAYDAARYPGDLGELALAEPARPNRAWRRGAWGVAIAASLLAVIALRREGPMPEPTPSAAAPATRVVTERPKLMAQMNRLERFARPKRIRLNRPAVLLDTASAKLAPPPLRLKPATRPTLVRLAAPTTTTPSMPLAREPQPRRRRLASPSFALRSMNDAISLGT